STGPTPRSPPSSKPPRAALHPILKSPLAAMPARALPTEIPQMPRVLIADKLSPAAVEIFKQRGIETDMKTGLSKDELLAIIGDYDGLVVRSDTKPNKDVIAAARNLKVIGRAGIGVDNIDIPAATAAGI